MLMKTVLEKAEQNSFSDESFMQLCALYQAQNERLGSTQPEQEFTAAQAKLSALLNKEQLAVWQAAEHHRCDALRYIARASMRSGLRFSFLQQQDPTLSISAEFKRQILEPFFMENRRGIHPTYRLHTENADALTKQLGIVKAAEQAIDRALGAWEERTYGISYLAFLCGYTEGWRCCQQEDPAKVALYGKCILAAEYEMGMHQPLREKVS